jgi:hypothetical protein
MQNAVIRHGGKITIVQAGPDAPRYAQCVWCGMPVELNTYRYLDFGETDTTYHYEHTSDLSANECQRLRDAAQAELDKVLNLNRKDS